MDDTLNLAPCATCVFSILHPSFVVFDVSQRLIYLLP